MKFLKLKDDNLNAEVLVNLDMICDVIPQAKNKYVNIVTQSGHRTLAALSVEQLTKILKRAGHEVVTIEEPSKVKEKGDSK